MADGTPATGTGEPGHDPVNPIVDDLANKDASPAGGHPADSPNREFLAPPPGVDKAAFFGVTNASDGAPGAQASPDASHPSLNASYDPINSIMDNPTRPDASPTLADKDGVLEYWKRAGTASPASPEQPQQRATEAVAREAEAKALQEWAALMDSMEASTETQGQYFASYGQKRNEVGVDSRALVIITPHEEPSSGSSPSGTVETGSPKTFVVITRDGAKRIVFENRGGLETVLSGRLRDRAEHPGVRDHENGTGYYGDRLSIYFNTKGSGADSGAILNLEDADPEIVPDVIKKSIEASESPFKTRVDEANKSATVATNLKSMITALPPRA